MVVSGNCEQCGKQSDKLRQCQGRCGGAVAYCGVECQRLDWKNGHKSICGKTEASKHGLGRALYKCPAHPYRSHHQDDSDMPPLELEPKQPSEKGKPNEELLSTYDIVFATGKCPPSCPAEGSVTVGTLKLMPTEEEDDMAGYLLEGTLEWEPRNGRTCKLPDFLVCAPTKWGTPPQAKKALRIIPRDDRDRRRFPLFDGWIFVVKESSALPRKQGDSYLDVVGIEEAERQNEMFVTSLNGEGSKSEDLSPPYFLLEKGDLWMDLGYGDESTTEHHGGIEITTSYSEPSSNTILIARRSIS